MYGNCLKPSPDCALAAQENSGVREPGPEGTRRRCAQASAGKCQRVPETVQIAFSEARERLGVSTNDVYRRKADLEIPVSKLYGMMDIN
jgi:hypothetical protein